MTDGNMDLMCDISTTQKREAEMGGILGEASGRNDI